MCDLGVLKSVKFSLDLLNRRDRSVLLVIVGIQLIVSMLDLLGILLLGVVAAIAASGVTGESIPTNALNSFTRGAPTDVTFVVSLAIVAGLALISKSVLGFLLTRRAFRFLANRQALVASSLARRLLSQPILTVQRRSSQETSIALTSGVNALTLGTLGPAIIIAAEISLVSILFIGLLAVDPLVALFSLFFFGTLVVVLHYLLASWATQIGQRQSKADIESFASVQHSLRTYREISVSNRRGLFATRFQQLRWDAARVLADHFLLSQIGKYVFEIGLVVGGGLLVLIVAATKDVSNAIGIITIFLASSARIFPSLLRMQAAFLSIRAASGIGAVARNLIEELDIDQVGRSLSRTDSLDSENEALTHAIQAGFTGFRSTISVSEVSLTYPGESTRALDAVSIEIPSGQSVALVGKTGAGKSTLADVILGVLQPDSGTVFISGLTPSDCAFQWPGAMAYVPQDVAILTGTVRDNVALGIPQKLIEDSLVYEALERAQLSTFLQESRKGLDTVVGENGVQLSGGQRQRLGIARALYSRPKLLVLDEATSALDSETERIITDTLDSLARDVTLIVIAHRLATVRHCDQVIHLSNGRITGHGTFDEVRAQVPEFNQQAALLGL